MPGRVRWSAANIFHSPPPPLASSSSSSAASSDGPLTPPVVHTGLPGPTPFVPRPSHYASRTIGRAHPLIAFYTPPLLNYDVSLHPSSISTHYRGVSTVGFLESATYPPETALTLITPHLPWAVIVAAANGCYVTVSDVLNAVYCSLRVNVTTVEFLTLGTNKLKHQVSEAYRRRYERLRGHRGYREEKQLGIRRVDFLMGYTKFKGISPASGRSSDVWQLHIS
ncbi:hypothetical protein C8F04DRAFT_1095355 [Mycena alexandri]|uniref:DUF6699 domain-containing protein n=1 Tax=Mycena alexandri TaxID=1745969 RepID=A0AAD6X5K8_9AGAR|nr:hypothetical protein C8F04DRAFT_1095355 [Mycena alexandri]